MARRSPFDPDIVKRVQSLATDTDWSATQIHRLLEAEFCGRDLPSRRAVQGWVKRYRPADPSGPWSLLDADPADAALVLPVLAAVLTGTRGRHIVTRAEADMVARLRTACPDVPVGPSPWGSAWYLARLYLARQTNDELTDDLDALLALAPWRDGGSIWRTAVDAGWIRAAPMPRIHDAPAPPSAPDLLPGTRVG